MRKYLEYLRHERKFTQEEVANRIGIKQNSYSSIEQGKRQKDMSYSMMERLAIAFSIHIVTIIRLEIDYMLDDEGEIKHIKDAIRCEK